MSIQQNHNVDDQHTGLYLDIAKMPRKRAKTSTDSSDVPKKVAKTRKRGSVKGEEPSKPPSPSSELDYSDSMKPKPLEFVPTPEFEPFPIDRLPTELRLLIFRHHLTISGMVKPVRTNKNLSSWTRHIKNCPFNQHELIKHTKSERREIDIIECKSSWGEITEIPIPHSVLVLLLASRSVFEEALPLFYRHNHFALCGGSTTPLYSFLNGIGHRRRCYIGEVSIEFDSRKAREAFTLLAESKMLAKLHMNVCLGRLDWMGHNRDYFHLPETRRDGDLRHAVGYEELSQLRGLKVVELSGTDRIWMPAKPGISSHFHHIDINSEGAAGPNLRKLLMQPRPVEKLELKEEECEEKKSKVTRVSPRKSLLRARTEEGEDSSYEP